MQRYRSGHNEAVLKTVCPQGHVGSNPTLCAKEKSRDLCEKPHKSRLFSYLYILFPFFPSSSLFLYALNAVFSKLFHQIFRNKVYLFACTAESKFFMVGTCIEQKNTSQETSLFQYSHTSPIISATYCL